MGWLTDSFFYFSGWREQTWIQKERSWTYSDVAVIIWFRKYEQQTQRERIHEGARGQIHSETIEWWVQIGSVNGRRPRESRKEIRNATTYWPTVTNCEATHGLFETIHLQSQNRTHTLWARRLRRVVLALVGRWRRCQRVQRRGEIRGQESHCEPQNWQVRASSKEASEASWSRKYHLRAQSQKYQQSASILLNLFILQKERESFGLQIRSITTRILFVCLFVFHLFRLAVLE